jgi:phage shock protein A
VSAPLAGTAAPNLTLPPADYNEAGVPSLDFVRDKIEGRYGRSLGATELAQETPEARSLREQAAKREEAAHDRLEAIRRSLRGDAPS